MVILSFLFPIIKDLFRSAWRLRGIRQMLSLNLAGRLSLAAFHEICASLALKQKLNSTESQSRILDNERNFDPAILIGRCGRLVLRTQKH